MRQKLFVSTIAAGLIAVPAALAATVVEPASPANLPAFTPFAKKNVREFKQQERLERKRRRAIERKRLQRQFASVEVPPALESIAACESGGDPASVSSSGTYRGKYQFSYATWAGVGGSGDPAAASEAEQDYRAALLYNRSGAGQWPVCGS